MKLILSVVSLTLLAIVAPSFCLPTNDGTYQLYEFMNQYSSSTGKSAVTMQQDNKEGECIIIHLDYNKVYL